MNLNLSIASRYLFGKKSTNAINLITGIAVLGITLGTASLILVLSVFNGFENLISGLLNNFNPDLKVEVIEGKVFQVDSVTWSAIQDLEGVSGVSRALEETALFEYGNTQEVGIIKGVDDQFQSVTRIDSTLRYGDFLLDDGQTRYAVLGAGINNKLGVSHSDIFTPIKVYMPLRKKRGPLAKDFKSMQLYPAGVFSVQSDNDFRYILASYSFVEKLLEVKDVMSSLEIDLNEDANVEKAKKSIAKLLGPEYIVKNRYQQDEAYLKLMNIEKWVSYLILSLILVLVAFNLIGALWMIVLDKKRDISVLKTMGFTAEQVKKLFLLEGLLISMLGLIIGIAVAVLLYLLQKNMGLITVPEGFIIDAYPIKMRLKDVLIISATVILLGYLGSILPARRAARIPTYMREE